MSFLFVYFEFLAFFLTFLLPTFSLPLANPPVLDTYFRAFMDGTSSAETEPRTVVELLPTAVSAKETLLAYAAPTPAPSPDSPILFLPQDPSPGGFVIAEPGAAANSSLGSGPVPANNTSSQPPATGGVLAPLMMAYYPDWVARVFPPERIDFSRFDWIDFAFAEPDENFALGLDEYGDDILSRLVNLAHQRGTKVKLSVGGWTGSKYFSWAVQNESSRHTFVGNIKDVYSKHSLDGIDIDWEYPNASGNAGNHADPSDTANLLEFLKLLRAQLPPTACITAAVQTVPFTGANGQPVNDVRVFADVLDWALLMNYDVWGVSPNPGPNSPLSNACRNSSQPTANAEAAVNAWTAAGFPSNKLVLGVPSYGYVSHSSAAQLRQRNENALLFDVHAVSDDGSGQVQFRDLVRQNVLCKDTAGAYVGCDGFTRGWDACSSTPFLRSDKEEQIVTYDDAQSLGLKSAFAKQHGLLGVNMFDVHGDTDEWVLVDALRQGLGL